MFHYSYFLCWDINILPIMIWIAKVFLLLNCSNQIRKIRKKSKVSGSELNHDYISYSQEIQYRWNRGSGPFISFFHVRIRRPIESACSWMLHRNPSLFLSSTEKGSFRVTRKFYYSFFLFFVMVMQCKRSEIRLFLMMKRAFFIWINLKPRDWKVGILWSDT